mmetsp:Transcript_114865/g.245231  ORF Transcript_114865/g.245231 Transcript_114865/m.245231 type:complete len:177 (+) Transcript_114865:30-560(+)
MDPILSPPSPTAAADAAAALREPRGDGLGLFENAHSFFETMAREAETLKKEMATNEEERRLEIEEIKKELAAEKLDRRDGINALRYEFESFVHLKINKVLDDVEDMKRTEKRKDSKQQWEIDTLMEDIERLKANLAGVQLAWGKLVTNVLDPDRFVTTPLVRPDTTSSQPGRSSVF